MKSSKLGDVEVLENPFATNDYMFETSPLGEDFENPFGSNDYMFQTPLTSKNYDTMFTSIYTCKDNYPLVHDDTMPPVFDTYCDDKDATNYNCNHLSNIQLVYHVQVLYDNPTIDTFMHVDHDKNALCDSYIVEFIHDATKSYYERGNHGFMYLNNIKFPLFVLKISKLHLFFLSMLVASCFNDLFSYKAPLHRKWVRLKCV